MQDILKDKWNYIETMEALEDNVDIVNVGDVKIEPEELKLIVRVTINFLNIATISFHKISIFVCFKIQN